MSAAFYGGVGATQGGLQRAKRVVLSAANIRYVCAYSGTSKACINYRHTAPRGWSLLYAVSFVGDAY